MKGRGVQKLDRVHGHCDTAVNSDLEAPVKGGGIHKLDCLDGGSDSVTRCNPSPGLNLKVGKMNYRLGTLDPIWAISSKSGQNFSRRGQFFIHLGFAVTFFFWTLVT